VEVALRMIDNWLLIVGHSESQEGRMRLDRFDGVRADQVVCGVVEIASRTGRNARAEAL